MYTIDDIRCAFTARAESSAKRSSRARALRAGEPSEEDREVDAEMARLDAEAEAAGDVEEDPTPATVGRGVAYLKAVRERWRALRAGDASGSKAFGRTRADGSMDPGRYALLAFAFVRGFNYRSVEASRSFQRFVLCIGARKVGLLADQRGVPCVSIPRVYGETQFLAGFDVEPYEHNRPSASRLVELIRGWFDFQTTIAEVNGWLDEPPRLVDQRVETDRRCLMLAKLNEEGRGAFRIETLEIHKLTHDQLREVARQLRRVASEPSWAEEMQSALRLMTNATLTLVEVKPPGTPRPVPAAAAE